MSRIGKQPVNIPENVQVKIESGVIYVDGPKGKLNQNLVPNVNVEIKESQIIVSVDNPKNKEQRAKWGLQRSLINNMVIGVTNTFEKKLEINGVGYKASISGQKLTILAGYSHPVDYDLPEGISGSVEKNLITIVGIDKQLVGTVADKIRKIRKPEPYKGKGIRYFGEVVRRKEGKTSKS
ncbi:MAG: 50S ribosomal protein L6 [Patescibacteria group bacterium]|nr:50S ribosomal protein L6 [Patescibacteria group bacterium]MDD4304623.1 50S ribosomal protein L6 [Patescibacteria group bacterium]MDD4695550.1 50S ribosomal protein L6 [Patescibacteria group bacterium]